VSVTITQDKYRIRRGSEARSEAPDEVVNGRRRKATEIELLMSDCPKRRNAPGNRICRIHDREPLILSKNTGAAGLGGIEQKAAGVRAKIVPGGKGRRSFVG